VIFAGGLFVIIVVEGVGDAADLESVVLLGELGKHQFSSSLLTA
jgi:hypothetical protein